MRFCNHKKWYLAVLLLASAGAHAYAQDATGQRFYLGSRAHRRMGRVFESYSYFVEWSQLPSAVRWEPGSAPFPFEVNVHASGARSFVCTTKHITNSLTLEHVEIRSLDQSAPSQYRRFGRNEPEGFSNQWSVWLSFLIQPGDSSQVTPLVDHEVNVVMLLDGTYASEEPWNKEEVRRDFRISDEVKHSEYRKEPPDKTFNGPRWDPDIVDRPDFSVPKKQWAPFSEALPVDLSAQAVQARGYLVAQTSIAADSLTLRKIELQHFLPTQAIQAQGLNVFTNMGHWYVVFHYFNDDSGTKVAYEVCVLLDGTVLGIRESNSVWE